MAGQGFAFPIGSSNFEDDSGLENLLLPENDVDRLNNALTAERT